MRSKTAANGACDTRSHRLVLNMQLPRSSGTSPSGAVAGRQLLLSIRSNLSHHSFQPTVMLVHEAMLQRAENMGAQYDIEKIR